MGVRLLVHLVMLVGALTLAGCSVYGPLSATASTPSLITIPAPATGVIHGAAPGLLVTAADLPSYRADAQAASEPHPGPGRSSATAHLVTGNGGTALHLYVRVSVFANLAQTRAEYTTEQTDIGLSASMLQTSEPALGDAWSAYSVVSGAGSGATSSVGILARERNALCNLVLTGPSSGASLAELYPLAQRQVAKMATAA